jgi:archaellum component FlaC
MKKSEFENYTNMRINDLYSITGKEILNVKKDLQDLKKEVQGLQNQITMLKFRKYFW